MVQVLRDCHATNLRFDSSLRSCHPVRPTANHEPFNVFSIQSCRAVFTTETISRQQRKSTQFEQNWFRGSILRWNPLQHHKSSLLENPHHRYNTVSRNDKLIRVGHLLRCLSFSNSSNESSGFTNFTISTLLNWWRQLIHESVVAHTASFRTEWWAKNCEVDW